MHRGWRDPHAQYESLSVPLVRKETFVLPRPLVIALTILITVMWATNLIVGWYLADGRADPAVNAIFAIVAGAVYGLQLRAKKPDSTDSQTDDRGDQS